MDTFINAVAAAEDELLRTAADYAVRLGVINGSPLDEEARRAQVSELTSLLTKYCENAKVFRESDAGGGCANDPVAKFGAGEMQRLREHGGDPLSLMEIIKHYRRFYIEVAAEARLPWENYERCKRIIDRFFDRVEMGMLAECAIKHREHSPSETPAFREGNTLNDNKYLTIFENIPHPVILLTEDLRIDNMNIAAKELMAELAAAPHQDGREGMEDPDGCVPRGDAAIDLERRPLFQLLPLLEEFAGSGDPQAALHQRLQTRNGKIDFHVRMQRMTGCDGKSSSGVILTLTDVTEHREAGMALREALRRLDAIIEFLPDPTFVIDRDGKVIAWNRSIEEMTGVLKDKMIGKGGYEYALPFYGERRPILIDLVLDSNEEAGTPKYDAMNWRDDKLWGEVFVPQTYGGKGAYLAATASRLRDSMGNIVGAIESIRDITDRKMAEEEKMRLQTQLRQSQKLEAIGTLAGGIAHDFNNILSPIIGYTEMAINTVPPSSPLRSDLEQVLHAAFRARDLVRQILAFSRHGREQRMAPLDVGSIVKEALKLLRASLPTTIQLRQNIWKGAIMADATQIHQVLLNLCTNAAHAMNDRGILDVSLTSVHLEDEDLVELSLMDVKPGHYMKLSVSDTGCGMDGEMLQRIFDPYFTTKEVGKGSGLGLAVVHGIVKRHDGAITVASAVGGGSTFDVYFPCVDMPHEPFVQMTPSPVGGSERILLVDDEEMMTNFTARLLDQLGYHVTARTSPVDALELLRTQPDAFDLLITDYTMPTMTGAELAAEALRIQPGASVILCTGYSERITEKAAKDLGISEFVMKPLSMSQLAGVVRSVLDRRVKTATPDAVSA